MKCIRLFNFNCAAKRAVPSYTPVKPTNPSVLYQSTRTPSQTNGNDARVEALMGLIAKSGLNVNDIIRKLQASKSTTTKPVATKPVVHKVATIPKSTAPKPQRKNTPPPFIQATPVYNTVTNGIFQVIIYILNYYIGIINGASTYFSSCSAK